MSSPRITFTYQSASTADSWWLRLVQLGVEDDDATLADAADLIDTLYSIDACAEGTATEDPDTTTTDAVVETEVRRVVCSYDDQANIDVQMHVIRSNPSTPYRLALQGGELKAVETITETTTQTIVIEDADSITLDYPVLGEFSSSWAGTVYGASGSISPPIRRNGNTISFGGATIKAGTITATYVTEYDLATVTILGVDGEPGQCTARGFFHGLVEELELETPEPADELGTCRVLWTVPSDPHQIECYRTVYVSQRCQCSHDELSGYSYEEVVDCPEYVKRCPGVLNECRHYLGTVVAHEYVECASDMVEAVSHPAYYKKMCCQEPTVTLPQCKEQITSWRGGLPITGGAQMYYDLYGSDLEIIPVGPPGGICGTWTKKQQILSNNCCDGVEPLAWDAATSPEVMAPNSAVVIGVTGGGKYPYRWEVVGHDFQFSNGSKVIETTGNRVRLSALVGACGTALITVTDGCSSISGTIRSTAGKWVVVLDHGTCAEARAIVGALPIEAEAGESSHLGLVGYVGHYKVEQQWSYVGGGSTTSCTAWPTTCTESWTWGDRVCVWSLDKSLFEVNTSAYGPLHGNTNTLGTGGCTGANYLVAVAPCADPTYHDYSVAHGPRPWDGAYTNTTVWEWQC